MSEINQIFRNLNRRIGTTATDKLITCPNCGYLLDDDWYQSIRDDEIEFYFEHKVTKQNTSGQSIQMTEYKTYPQSEGQAPSYIEIHHNCQGEWEEENDSGELYEEECDDTIYLRLYIMKAEQY